MLSNDEYDNLRSLVDFARGSGVTVLNDWETNFIEDTHERLIRYGLTTMFTTKQLEVIERIERKLGIS